MSGGPEIVGIGAVNLDYIVGSGAVTGSRTDPAAGGPDAAVAASVLEEFSFGSERAITEAEATRILGLLEPLSPVAGPGGSALNTVATIAATGAGPSVGYVGLCGRTPSPSSPSAFSFRPWFASLGIDDRRVIDVDELTGVCISYTADGQRSLLTTPGANRNIMDHLRRNAETLVGALADASVIHATSFAGLDRIDPLVEILTAVKARSPELRLCCDPGALWTIDPVPAGVAELYGIADLVLVNAAEFASLERRGRRPDTTVVVKRPDRIEVLDPDGGSRIHRNPTILTDDDIVDDTGAGDAFAAGLLLALAMPELSDEDGIRLGMALAAEKLRWPGVAGIHRYAEIYRSHRPAR